MKHHNNFFCRRRFAAYFKKLWVEQWRTNIIRTGILFGTFLLLELWISITCYNEDYSYTKDYAHEALYIIFSVAIFGLGCLMAGQILAGGRRKGERIGMLTTPATPFENWLARWTMTVPLFLLVFFGCFYLADFIRVAVCSPIHPNIPITLLALWTGESESFNNFISAAQIYLLCSAVYTAGGVFFPRHPILKTSILMFFLAWFFFIHGIIGIAFFLINNNTWISTIGSIYGWLSIVFLWWLSYARFKELDITD